MYLQALRLIRVNAEAAIRQCGSRLVEVRFVSCASPNLHIGGREHTERQKSQAPRIEPNRDIDMRSVKVMAVGAEDVGDFVPARFE